MYTPPTAFAQKTPLEQPRNLSNHPNGQEGRLAGWW